MLGRYGLLVKHLRTKRPGYVVYQDQRQAAAAYLLADTQT